MRWEETCEKIAAYVDGELDECEKSNIQSLIQHNNNARKEYYIQLRIKNLIRKRFEEKQAPGYLYDAVLRRIKN